MRLLTVILGLCIFLTSCNESDHSTEPFANMDELDSSFENERFPNFGFSLVMPRYAYDGPIRIHFHTDGELKDHALIDPAVEKLRDLTSILQRTHRIEFVFIDGNPMSTIGSDSTGTGKIIRTVVFDKGT